MCLTFRYGPSIRKLPECEQVFLGSVRERLLSALITVIDSIFDGDMDLFKGSALLNYKQWPKSDEGSAC